VNNLENEPEQSKPEKSTGRYILELIEIVLIAFALSWVIRTYVLEPRVIPSGSMLPTIQLQDRVIVDKFFFKTFDQLHSGDVIVFHPPASVDSADDFIKRLIALPGDTIEIRNHKTYINGQPLLEPYLLEQQTKNVPPTKIPEGFVFVMGDNRNNSSDSRAWGLLPIENISGRTLFRYWPLQRFGALAR
jgi:signal peptidase I